ncbi:MAG: iron-sulfur cluster assembly accessory protein [Gammaproteobacteria bacterium]|nr:iron-sulfur cluster assembly accessory protein [Gammaproteobacteria bacterium]
MITITPAAAEQIRVSAKQGQMDDLAMRIAATQNPDGSIRYGMGFDDNQMDGDILIKSEGIDVVVSASSMLLVQGMTLDFVELEPGSYQFIFLNPNDPNFNAPNEV